MVFCTMPSICTEILTEIMVTSWILVDIVKQFVFTFLSLIVLVNHRSRLRCADLVFFHGGNFDLTLISQFSPFQRWCSYRGLTVWNTRCLFGSFQKIFGK